VPVESTTDTSDDKEHLQVLWQSYKSNGDAVAKEELLLHYLGLVKYIVRRMMPKYSSFNEYDDLLNCGMLGLIDAVDKFDLQHGVQFETYASTRIRGEIIDYMRSQDWAPSSMRKKLNAISSAYEQLESRNGRHPTDDELAREVDMPVASVQKLMATNHMFNLVSFEDTLRTGFSATEIAAPEDETPENVLLRNETSKLLAEAIEMLPEKERLVITLYYYEDLLLRDIAELLGVTESRVSQIHSKALTKLRAKMQKVV